MTSARVDAPNAWSRWLRIANFAWPYRVKILIALGMILLAAGFSLVFPLGIRALLDTALAGRDHATLHGITALLFLIFLLRSCLAFAGHYVLELAGERMVIDLRKVFFSHLHTLDHHFFFEQRVGDLTSRLGTDTAAIRNLVTEVGMSLINQVFQITGGVLIMFYLNWRLTLIVLLVAPTSTLLSRFFSPRLRQLAKEVQTRTGRSMAVVQESLTNVHLVKAYARAPHEMQKFASTLVELFKTLTRSVRTHATFRALISLITATASIVIFWYGGLEVLRGRLSAGDLIAFLFYSQTIASGLGHLAQLYGDISYAAGASDRIFEILDRRPTIFERDNAIRPVHADGAIAFKNVSFGYEPGRWTIRDVSFEIHPGDRVAIVGPSGAGKSTLLHLICRFFDPNLGQVSIDGHDLRNVQLEWLRNHVALVSQDVHLFAGTILENIRYGRLDATDEDVEAAARGAQIERFIRGLPDGYQTEIGERGVRLSGGQKQRLALARALLKNARILLLDEATSAVDSESEQNIWRAILNTERPYTVVTIAHRLASVTEADRILVVHDGRLVEAGSHAELSCDSVIYQRLLRTQLIGSQERIGLQTRISPHEGIST